MQWINTYELQMHEPVQSSQEWQGIQVQLRAAIEAIVWPPDSTKFTINPTKKGNGVPPIKQAFIDTLKLHAWETQRAAVPKVGKVDAVLSTAIGVFGVEWETGNISSSHRSLNRLSLGLHFKTLVGGILVLPSRKLYSYLTDRIGNVPELSPYFTLYKLLPLQQCMLVVLEIEHDSEDPSVQLIKKGTDGWALIAKSKREASQQQKLFE